MHTRIRSRRGVGHRLRRQGDPWLPTVARGTPACRHQRQRCRSSDVLRFDDQTNAGRRCRIPRIPGHPRPWAARKFIRLCRTAISQILGQQLAWMPHCLAAQEYRLQKQVYIQLRPRDDASSVAPLLWGKPTCMRSRHKLKMIAAIMPRRFFVPPLSKKGHLIRRVVERNSWRQYGTPSNIQEDLRCLTFQPRVGFENLGRNCTPLVGKK